MAFVVALGLGLLVGIQRECKDFGTAEVRDFKRTL
jgi:hypothetical protein